MITDLRNLHGQLQTVASILAGAEQTAVQVNAGVVVTARSRPRRGLHVCVAGATVVGGTLTGSRKEENQIVKAAEEAAQDHFCTVGCGRQGHSGGVNPTKPPSPISFGGFVVYGAAHRWSHSAMV